jgi:hypothetical protein
MRACRHFKKFGLDTEIEPSENPWNAWIYVYDEHGNLYWSSFETGLYWIFLEHLHNSIECLREVSRETEEDPSSLRLRVANQLGYVQKAWTERTGGTQNDE